MTGLTTTPLVDGGTGNNDGDGDMGVVMVAVVGAAALVGVDDTIIMPVVDIDGSASPLVVVVVVATAGSISTTHFSEVKSGLGTKGEFPVFGTLDFHLSRSGPLDPAVGYEGC